MSFSGNGSFAREFLKDYLIAGELALSGKTRYVKGGLSMAMLAQKQGRKGVLLPIDSSEEACLLEGMNVFPIGSLSEAVAFFKEECPHVPLKSPITRVQNELN